jgi:hypothetical protein
MSHTPFGASSREEANDEPGRPVAAPDVRSLFEAERDRPPLSPGEVQAIRQQTITLLASGTAPTLPSRPFVGLLSGALGAALGAWGATELRPPRTVRVVEPRLVIRTVPSPPPSPPTEADAGVQEQPARVDSAAPRRRAEAPHDALSREQLYLQRARSALVRRDEAEALRALTLHRRLFPDGALSEEREALLVSVLADLGRIAEARARAEDFHRRWPSSILQQMVEDALRADGGRSP